MNQLESSGNLIVLVVLCSMTNDRYEIAKRVLDSIKELENDPNYQIIIIDNGSSMKIPFQELPLSARYLEMKSNLGYWGILYWFLFSQQSPIFDYESEYVYIVESDHVHFNARLLRDVVIALNKHTKIVSARVQEFSVNFRWFYSKSHRLLPFRVRRSITSLRNAVTGERVKFCRTMDNRDMYLARWHARLPSVSRLSALRSVFNELSMLENFTEFDFFRLMRDLSEEVLVLNHGIFFPASSASNSKKVLSGSWITNYKGQFAEYQPTRQSQLNSVVLEQKVMRDSKTH